MLRIEICLGIAAILWAFAFPHFGSRWFERIESGFSRFAQLRALSVVTVGIFGCCPAARPEVKWKSRLSYRVGDALMPNRGE
jgi:hypothetical protein